MKDAYDVIVGHLRAQSASKIFEIGCGYGELGLRLRASGFKGVYKGLDRDPKAIEQLKDSGLKGQEGDLRWYDGMKFYWDTIVMKDVLEELDELSLLADAFLMTRRLFVLATQAPLYDSLAVPPKDTLHFYIDDILSCAKSCSFHIIHFEQFGSHNILLFTRRKKRK